MSGQSTIKNEKGSVLTLGSLYLLAQMFISSKIKIFSYHEPDIRPRKTDMTKNFDFFVTIRLLIFHITRDNDVNNTISEL